MSERLPGSQVFTPRPRRPGAFGRVARTLATLALPVLAVVASQAGCSSGEPEDGMPPVGVGGDPGSSGAGGGGGGGGSSSGGATTSGSSSGGGGSSSGGATTSSSGGGTTSGGTTTPPPDTSAPDATMREIVNEHNKARANVSPAPASPLPMMVWNAADAAVAQQWANNCRFEHNPGRGQRGENLYASSGSSTPRGVVGSWDSEKQYYNYANNSCSRVCGHYTQVVWSTSTQVGCAMKRCTTGSPFGGGAWDLWVCNYSPPGNFNGRKPY